MKNKNLFVSMLAGLFILLGAKDMLISFLGDHTGVITVAILTLIYQALSIFMKRFYNTGNWLKGWSTAFIVLNIATFIPELIGVFNAWAQDSSVVLSTGFMMVMTKITVFANLIIFIVNADWTSVMSKLDAGQK